MLHIKTRYEWEDYFDDMDESLTPWHSLKSRFEVKLPSDKVKQKEIDIQHWLVTNFNYDIYGMIDNERCELSTQMIQNIKTNVRINNLTTETRRWGRKREIPNSEAKIQDLIDAATAWHTAHSVTKVYSFYFLSEEDAMAFKLAWI